MQPLALKSFSLPLHRSTDLVAYNSLTDVYTLALASVQKNKVFLGKGQLNTAKTIVIEHLMNFLAPLKELNTLILNKKPISMRLTLLHKYFRCWEITTSMDLQIELGEMSILDRGLKDSWRIVSLGDQEESMGSISCYK